MQLIVPGKVRSCCKANRRKLLHSKTLLIMKFLTFFMLVFCLQISAKSSGQITLSEKNVSLEKVFKLIEKQSGYHFWYDKALLKKAKPLSIDVQNVLISKVLDMCLQGEPLTYTILDKLIAIQAKPDQPLNTQRTELTLPPAASLLDDITVVVRDTADMPLSGVSIRVKGTQKGVITDANGAAILKGVDPKSTLEISFTGYSSTEVTIGNNKTINVRLSVLQKKLDELVVVSYGYGTLNKKEVTSAITHLSSKDLLSYAGNGVLNSIQGKVAGLSVTNTAQADPNSTPGIQLRGVSSRNAGLGPLYVINGVPGGNIDNLNQNDIESIDVLKGGAASAIFGTRGSNGVIIITTKKGTSQSQALYDGYMSFDFINNKLKVLSHDEFLQRGRGTDYGGNTDWLKAVSRDFAFQHKQTMQFSGGNKKSNYIVSFDYRKANGLDLRSDKEEYGARLNLNHTSENNLYTAVVTIAPRYTKSNNANYEAFTQSRVLNPTNPIWDTTNPSKYNYINNGFSGSFNPVEDLKTVQTGTEGKFLDMSASFRLNILKSLYTQVILGEQTSDFFGFGFTPSTYTGAINGNAGRNSAGRNYDKNDQKNFEWTGNYSLNAGRHSVKLLAGYVYNYSSASGLSANNQNFPSDVLTYNNLGQGVYNLPIPTNGSSGDFTFRQVGTYKNDSKLIAFLGRLNYDFDKKYFFSASLRREGSSKFGFAHKWGNFPAVSVGWRLSDENFFPKVSWLKDLKLRADYGETGNQDFGSYLSLDTYSGFGYYSYNGTSYRVWGPSQNSNYDLRWEKAQNFNVGLDFELLNNRLTGALNYYTRTNKDLLGDYNVPVPPNVQSTTYANVGTMKNSGFEIQLNGTLIANRNFTYNISFAGASNNNKFVSFSNNIYQGQNFVDVVNMPPPGSPGTSQRLQEGRRIGSFFMLRSAGIDATGRLLVYSKDGKVIPGNQASLDDKQFVGNGLPKFTASFGNTFTYKQFDLSVYLRGAFGYQIFNTVAFYTGTPVTQQGANVLASAFGDGKYAALTNPETYSNLSDYFLEQGDFVKIDNLTIGYNFKSPVKNVTSGRFYLTARNLYTFTNWTGGDPDLVNVNGLTPGVNASLSYYPSTLQIIAGLQIKF